MADEIDNEDPEVMLIKEHLKSMRGILDKSQEYSQQLSDDLIAGVKKHSGLRSQLVSHALDSLGIKTENKP